MREMLLKKSLLLLLLLLLLFFVVYSFLYAVLFIKTREVRG